ncbi:Anti-sigma regulatory factor (Ser/Thr protein kinase) [Streptomyces sp. WMMB 714]|uniref:ATP-binding protein n=1 Tax=Streptomyces sp. WMMB 714 TaxID=1286822 RepID=UPI000697AD1E|nr:ATP-binding protein [Streptomyces sp. WMMB 714]SCK25951.1 Anti-sigma regulatory factor (Ser/Thr protein kinase) [Streptomyces sp. WMMB 714]
MHPSPHEARSASVPEPQPEHPAPPPASAHDSAAALRAEENRGHLARRCCVTLTIPLLAEAEALAPVRHRVGAWFELWGLPEPAGTARLCVSELLTNVIVHVGPGTPVTLHASMAGPRPRLSLTDPLPGPLPAPRPPGTEAQSGRGLLLLDALTHRWGVVQHRAGKTIWCELDG